MNKHLGWVLSVLLVSTSFFAQTPEAVASYSPTRSVVRVTGGGSCDAPHQGSGVVVAPGLVATNAHVVGESIALIVWKDDRSWPAQIEAVAPEMDLCLLRVPGLTVSVAESAAPEQLMPGLEVISVGYPGTKTPVIRAGRLTFLWSYCGSKLIQSDAMTQRGSSGGGLFSKDGRLLGITTFIFHSSGFMNFSIPVAWVKSLIQRPRLEAPIALCRPMDAILRDFLGEMSEDPANGENWEGFTRSWVKDNPNDPDAWTALGYALHRKLETQATANTVLNSQLLEETAAAATKAIQLDANHARAWNNLGVTLGLENRYEEAERAYLKAIAIDPGYALAWFNLGVTRFNSGRHLSAVEALSKSTALKADESKAWALLAISEAHLQRWKDSAAHLEIALRYQPYNATWWLDRAEACFHGGMEAAYKAALAKLDSLDPKLAKEARALKPRSNAH